jgi:chromosome segregation ATPase
MKWYFVVVAAFGLVITSCKNDNKKELLSEIDKMENTLDSLETITNDTIRYDPSEIIASVRATILNVKKHYIADTIDYKLANQMNSYKEIRKVISKNSGNLAKAKQTIPEVQQKLDDLKHDIENGVNDRDKYQEFINFEKSKIHEIEEVLKYYIQTTDKYYTRYDSLHPIIKNLGDSLVKISND